MTLPLSLGIGTFLIVIGTLLGILLGASFPAWYQPTLIGLGLLIVMFGVACSLSDTDA